MTQYLISHDLSYHAGQTCLLDRINSRFSSGQINMLIGNNGAGKTTLLRLLAGFLKPSSGSISINGKDLHSLNLKQLARRRAVLPQHDTINTVFSTHEIISFAELPFADQSTNPSVIIRTKKLKAEIIEELEIKDLQDRLYHTLSGGERQRVRLARVILQARLSYRDTGWLILDEPLASLDWGHQHKLLDYLRYLATEGLGILLVLHDLNSVLQYADEVCLLHEGQVFESGRSSDVLSEDNVRNIFKVNVGNYKLGSIHPI